MGTVSHVKRFCIGVEQGYVPLKVFWVTTLRPSLQRVSFGGTEEVVTKAQSLPTG